MQKYIHYGTDSFEKEAFDPVTNMYLRNKPDGGLWASRIDSRYGWKEWCEDNEFHLDWLEHSFTFTLKDNANVIQIETPVDIVCKLPLCEGSEIRFSKNIDFEDCIKRGIDAIEIIDIDKVYYDLYGWDCDCILILNPDIIVV